MFGWASFYAGHARADIHCDNYELPSLDDVTPITNKAQGIFVFYEGRFCRYKPSSCEKVIHQASEKEKQEYTRRKYQLTNDCVKEANTIL